MSKLLASHSSQPLTNKGTKSKSGRKNQKTHIHLVGGIRVIGDLHHPNSRLKQREQTGSLRPIEPHRISKYKQMSRVIVHQYFMNLLYQFQIAGMKRFLHHMIGQRPNRIICESLTPMSIARIRKCG